MSDAAWFVLVFGGLFILRGVAATIVFLWILPEGDRCPQCDAETLRMQPGRWSRWLLGRFRRSWCLKCGWHGMHRDVPAVTTPVTAQPVRAATK